MRSEFKLDTWLDKSKDSQCKVYERLWLMRGHENKWVEADWLARGNEDCEWEDSKSSGRSSRCRLVGNGRAGIYFECRSRKHLVH